MIHPDLLNLVRCPVTHSRLHLADDRLVAGINRAIEAGQVEDRGGHAVCGTLQGALINEDHSLAYAVDEGIPSLLADEAIPLHQFADITFEKGSSHG